jgi:hypothetical protein
LEERHPKGLQVPLEALANINQAQLEKLWLDISPLPYFHIAFLSWMFPQSDQQ